MPVRSPTSGIRTNLLYSGEQFNPVSGLQYLRARWYNPQSGRFNRLDPFAGNQMPPLSFHKYAYAHMNPVMGIDPSGMSMIGSMLSTISNGFKYVGRTIVSAFKALASALKTVATFLGRLVARELKAVISSFRESLPIVRKGFSDFGKTLSRPVGKFMKEYFTAYKDLGTMLFDVANGVVVAILVENPRYVIAAYNWVISQAELRSYSIISLLEKEDIFIKVWKKVKDDFNNIFNPFSPPKKYNRSEVYDWLDEQEKDIGKEYTQ